ncbi:hypothetical protein ACRCUN_10685 [Mycobacterium sp. LTG2003]
MAKPDPLEIELAALGRLSVDLNRLGGSLKRISEIPSMSATPDPDSDMPSLVAARPVSTQTIRDLQATVADRFTEVGYLVDQARTLFRDADDDRAWVIIRTGSLLPPD